MNSLSAKELQEHFKEKDVKRFLDAAKTEREKEGGNKNAKWSDFAKTELADKKQELIDKDKQKEQESGDDQDDTGYQSGVMLQFVPVHFLQTMQCHPGK